MNTRHAQLVRSSFALVQPIARIAAATFYDHLFDADPTLRPLFKGDMVKQGERLMGMIGDAVGLLDRPAVLLPVLRSLGARHRGYGVRSRHYAAVGSALLKTLEEGLGDAFTADVHDAWVAVYAVISGAMQQGLPEQGMQEPALAA